MLFAEVGPQEGIGSQQMWGAIGKSRAGCPCRLVGVVGVVLLLVVGGVGRAGAQTRPASGPSSRPEAVRASPELLAMWKELEPKREAAAKLAKAVTAETLEEARANYKELEARTKEFNLLLAPVAEGSWVRYPSVQPKGGPGVAGLNRAIWLYNAGRAIEAYNATKAGEMTPDEYGVFAEVNRYREALGLLPLEYHAALRDSARGHSDWMKEAGKFDHEDERPGLKTFSDRIRKAGYKWVEAGENIAHGHRNPQAVFLGWFDSPGHHRNMLGNYTHMGIGKTEWYWTQNFGRGEAIRAGRVSAPKASAP